LAHDIRETVDKARRERGPNVLLKFPAELTGLVMTETTDRSLSNLIAPEALKQRVQYRGRDGALDCAAPPSEPDWQISRIRLSG
jgi:hypothetical protein